MNSRRSQGENPILMYHCFPFWPAHRSISINFSQNSASEQSKIRMQDLKNDKLDGKWKILLTDSANEQYRVSIFPADTFSFSAQNGFIGKASKIEVSGLKQRIISLSDSSVLSAEKQTAMRYVEQQESKKSEISNARVLEKKRWPPLMIIIMSGVLIVVGCLWLRRHLTQRFRWYGRSRVWFSGFFGGLSQQLRPAMKLVIIDGATYGGERAMSLS